MQWFKSIVREIFGLFVDDGSFALAILAWLSVVWLLLYRPFVSARWAGLLLFAGLGLILLESATRYARRRSAVRRR
jgi:putative exporter of polyketide antibiotics